jgi:SsrA-binding protein
MGIKIVATNRKARRNYFILDEFEAGIVLLGSEIKSVRAGQVSLAEAYVRVNDNQAWLIDAHIAPYEQAGIHNHDPKRSRKLLLHKKEIHQLWEQITIKGVAVIPLKMYIKNGLAKVEIAVGRGKKLYDKRQTIAKRDAEREMERQFKKKYK